MVTQENHSQITLVITDHHPLILIFFAEDHQIDEIHKIIYKTDIVDQLVKIISTEIFTLDQILIEVITQTVTEIAHTQIPGLHTIPMTAQEILHTTAIETIQTIVIGITLIMDSKTILTIDHTIVIIIIDPVTTPRKKQQLSKNIKKILSHRIEITHGI